LRGWISPATALRLGVAATGTTSAVAAFDLAPKAGSRVFTVAAGALGAGRGAAFQLIAVDTTATPWVASSVLAN